MGGEETRLRRSAVSGELCAGRFSTNIPPPLRDNAAVERQARTTLVETFAFALAMGLSASGSPVLGVVIGTLVLGYEVKREGLREQQLKRYLFRVCVLVVGVSAAYITRDVLVHWDDFKQGFVDGWNAV